MYANVSIEARSDIGANSVSGPAAGLFNSAIAAFAVVAATEVGLLDEIEKRRSVDLTGYAAAFDLHEPSLRAIVAALTHAHVLKVDGDIVSPARAFLPVLETKGFFVWLLGGCGELLRTAGTVTHNSSRQGSFIRRDAKVISKGCADFGSKFIDPTFDVALAENSYSRIVDLGCGGGDRLIRALRARPHSTGVGIDIAPAAIKLAREQLQAEGLADRATVIEADASDLRYRPEFADVDFAMCFLMGHDFWPRGRCVTVLRSLREVFPSIQTFAMCDAYRSNIVPSPELPILTLGFEYVHALMGQYLPSLDEWQEVFAASGWRPCREYELLMPFTRIFVLTPSSGGLR